MTAFAFPPLDRPSLAIDGSAQRFPVRRIFCVGRNYAAHAREMGQDPNREPPFFFTKPADAVTAGGDIAYPPLTNELHFEGELVVAIGLAGRNIPPENATSHIWGFAPGIDLTRRDLQRQAKAKGHPWDWGKAFDNSAVCGPVHRAQMVGTMQSGVIQVFVNGDLRQDSDLGQMIWPIPEVISFLSQSVTIQPGDLVYTGTPAGVGHLAPGDTCDVRIAGLQPLGITITP